MYISQNRLMWVFNEIQGQQRPLGGTNIDFSEFLMQSFCIEERGTDKNCSGTGLKRGVEMMMNNGGETASLGSVSRPRPEL